MTEPFGSRLRRAMDERGPLCVGIDPHASLLAEWGLGDDVAGLERFSRTVVEAPQMAMDSSRSMTLIATMLERTARPTATPTPTSGSIPC